jgi:hypothetical protein
MTYEKPSMIIDNAEDISTDVYSSVIVAAAAMAIIIVIISPIPVL